MRVAANEVDQPLRGPVEDDRRGAVADEERRGDLDERAGFDEPVEPLGDVGGSMTLRMGNDTPHVAVVQPIDEVGEVRADRTRRRLEQDPPPGRAE